MSTLTIAILTISDTRTKENDLSGKHLLQLSEQQGFKVVGYHIIPDSRIIIESQLLFYADNVQSNVILTTGGTGFGPRDCTPEATLAVIEKATPGISELIRMEGLNKTRRAMLSRAVSGLRGQSLIINLPGSPQGAKESFLAIVDLLPHCVSMIAGGGHDNG